jgi:stearoyl-CoA desaturase (delta-9 desaturase)
MKHYFKWNTAPFWFFHLFSLGVFFLPFRAEYLVWLGISYGVRMFFITAGYHRYFSHRAFETSRVFQFFMAFMAMTSSQKGVLWWAGHHRIHHRHSDGPGDLHSPNEGFWWSHFGWFLSDTNQVTPVDRIQDFGKFPELVWLDRNWGFPILAYLIGVTVFLGIPGLLYCGILGTTILWHGTFTINSLSHLWGSRRYETHDQSRNNPFLALITLGEGWHNNHHHSPSAARNGFFWYEFDCTYLVLKTLNAFGIVWNLRKVAVQRAPYQP